MQDEQKPEVDAPEEVAIDEKGKELPGPEEKKPEQTNPSDKKSRWHRFTHWYKTNKKKSIPLTIVILIAVLAAIPWTRYRGAAMAVSQDFTIKVMDSTAATPVSGADISVGAQHALTNANGVATLHQIKVGHRTVLITKKYYKDERVSVLVPILKQKTTPTIQFVATGRQAKISVKNVITNAPLADVDIKVADISAKTDKSGSATVVLPVGTTSEKATLSLNGYNDAKVQVKANDKTIAQNDFTMTPVGKVYFLSKLSGRIDVVKTNLDGTSRQTVLAGTGSEDDRGTILLASRDWKYLALLSRREGGTNAKLYLLNTSDDSLVTVDGDSGSVISPVGWSNHNFIYTLSRQNVPNWKPNAQALKSYSAESKKITILDQTRGEGTGQNDYASESYGSVYQIGQNVVYEKYWNADYLNQDRLNNKQAGIYSITATGANHQTLKTFGYAAGQNTFMTSVPDEAEGIYYQVYEKGKLAYYAYDNGKVSSKSNIADEFDKYLEQGAITYLQSPDGNETFWSEQRDGKNTLFVGDADGQNGKQIATLSDFQTYGWYTDDYLLVSKNSSELYIMPKTPSKDTKPVKITDYHKPSRSFPGYGGGYGGI